MNRIAVATTVLLTLLGLVGCSSPQAAPTDVDRAGTAVDGVDGQVGELRLLAVAIASPGGQGSVHIAGDSAALLLTIANDGKSADALIRASTPVAMQVVFRNDDAAPDPRVEVPAPPRAVAVLREVTGPHLELSGLRETLRTGSSVPVTFELRKAGSVTLNVPVAGYTDVRPDKYLPD